MEITFYRHSILNRGGDKMVVLHASSLAKQGHTVIIQTSVIDSIFNIPKEIIIKKNKTTTKIGTLRTAFATKFTSDIVIADIIVLSTILAFRNRKKIIYFAQDYDEFYYKNNIQKLLIRIIYYIGLLVYKIPIIAVSKTLAKILKKRFYRDVNVVENGIDTEIFFYDPSIVLKKNKQTENAILLLSRKDARKGFNVGIKVIKEFKKKYNLSFEVWTIGDPPGEFLHEIPYKHFGYVDENRLREIMSSSDVFLYPSQHEGFGLMVMESFACKCPVVTTDAVSYAQHGKNALKSKIGDYHNMADNLYLLITDKKLKEELIQSGRRYSEKHRLEDSCTKFGTIIQHFYNHM